MSKTLQTIPVSSIVLPSSTRSFDQTHAKTIAKSLSPSQELFQPIGVVADGSRYRLIWGRHRLGAYQLLGRDRIPAHVLPTETTPEDEIKYSLQENNLRRDESPEDMVGRVSQLAERLKISISEASKLAGVKPAYFSRWKTAIEKLTPEARSFARANGLGISDQYLVATKAKDASQQLAALKARANGTSRDELCHWFKENTSSQRVTKKFCLRFSIDGFDLQLRLPSNTDYDTVGKLLTTLKSRILTHRKSVPIRLLPEVLRNASTN